MCERTGECLPAQIDQVTNSLRSDADALAELRDTMARQLAEGVRDCLDKCTDSEGLTDAAKIARVSECLGETCERWLPCLEEAMR